MQLDCVHYYCLTVEATLMGEQMPYSCMVIFLGGNFHEKLEETPRIEFRGAIGSRMTLCELWTCEANFEKRWTSLA